MKLTLLVSFINKHPMPRMRQLMNYLTKAPSLKCLAAIQIITLLMLLGTAVSAQTWSSITPPSGGGGFLDIDFIDANNGALALTSGGDVAWTTNGAVSWSKNADIAADMYSVDMVDANTIFAIGGGGDRVRTLNGGSAWDKTNIFPGHFHGGIRFATPSVGWAADFDGRLFKTTNSGTSWTLQTNLGTIGFFTKGYVASTSIAYWPVGSSKTIKKTADGTTWSTVYTAPSAITCMTGLDANNVWAGLSDGTIVKTTDGGANWTSYSTGVNFQINAIDFVSANEGWLVGAGGRIFYSGNGGVTWTQQTSGTTNDLYGLSMVSSNLGFVCGGGQTLLKFTNCSAEINLQGGSPLVNIADGDAVPSTTDGTDFGTITAGSNLARTFTIQNTGTSALTISSITSSNVKFVVSGALTSVAAGSSASFTVTFSPTATGAQTSTITVNNSDCDEAVYDFAVTGTGALAGAALNFDGTDDIITLANESNFDFTTQMSVEAWINMSSSATSYARIVDKYLYAGNSGWILTRDPGIGGFRFDFNGQNGAGVATSASVSDNTWHHIAATFSNGLIKLYIDGVLNMSLQSAQTSIITNNKAITIGNGNDGSFSFPMNGSFDEIRIWNTVRTVEEISQYRNCELAGTECGLVAYYKFNQGFANTSNSSITTLTDATSGANNGTLTSFALTGANSNWVAPGGVITGMSCPTVTAPEVNIQGGSPLVNIADGDAVPSTTDGTDFGTITAGTNLARTFTIQNTGTSALTISSITVTGTNASEFVVSGAPTSVAAGSSQSFTVTFTPTANDLRTATVHVNNNDCDEADYDFAVRGAIQGAALAFNGSNNYVKCGSGSALVVTNAITMEAWVNQSAIDVNFKYIFNKEGEYEWAIVNGTVWHCFAISSAFWLWSNTGVTVTPNTWTHLAVTYDGTSIKLYKNGVLASTIAGSGNVGDFDPARNELWIGQRQDPAYQTNGYFNGKIDEVRVWNIARTCDQIQQSYACELAGTETGLVAYYKFNHGVAAGSNAGVTTLTDLAGGDNNGTLTNFTLSSTASNWIAPGGVTTGTSCSAVTAAEINVQGGSPLVSIVDGDITPSATDGTDFGLVAVNGNLARAFTIQNLGTAALTVSSITSSNARFTISGAPASVAVGGSATFTVTFSPIAAGAQTSTITVNNSDCDESVYDFAVTGTGCVLPSFTLCPSTQNANTDANSCSATVTYTATATATITYAFTGVTTGSGNGTGSGSIFNKGTTTVTLTATNSCGTATCTFDVVVTDNTAPAITCPANIAVNNDVNQCSAVVIYNTPAGTDNCSGAVTAQTGGLASGATYPIGTTTNTFRVTASNGQTSTCAFTVTVTDNQTPMITCPMNIAVGNDAGQCNAVVTYAAPVGTDNCSGASTARTGGLASGATYPLGVTTNTFTVTAGNGQTTSCAFTVTVSDTELPAITCPANKTVLQVQGSCISVATGIDATYSDNCGGTTLSYSSTGATTLSGTGQASGQTFNAGVTTVTYKATDAVAQMSTCSFTVTMSPCVQISGNIYWENNNAPVKSANVKLETLPGLTLVGIAPTDANGYYSVIPGAPGDYRVKPEKNTGLFNGVTAADATRIQQHIANNPPLVGPYKRIAADVNKSNSITTYDATLITQALVGNPASLAIFNTSWRFVPASYVFPLPTVPWGFPEKVDFTGLTTGQTNVNFIGMKIGDVNGSADPLLKPVHPLVWMVNEAEIQEGEMVEATFRVGQLEDIASFQFALSFDTRELALEDIQTAGPLSLNADNFGTYSSKDGEIRAVWAVAKGETLKEGTKVFTIRFKALNSGRKLGDLLHLEEEVLHGAAYNTELNEAGVELVFTDAEVSGTAEQDLTKRIILLQNQPNPTSGHTTIGFVLPQSCEAQLRIVDVNGRTVTAVNKSYPAGYQTEAFDLSKYPGVLYYELTTPYGSLVKKMVVAR